MKVDELIAKLQFLADHIGDPDGQEIELVIYDKNEDDWGFFSVTDIDADENGIQIISGDSDE